MIPRCAKLMPLEHPANPLVAEKFKQGKIYNAIYETNEKDKGWWVQDSEGSIHWLTPWDGQDHNDLQAQEFVMANFRIVHEDVKEIIP
jgi:hypothetical protein